MFSCSTSLSFLHIRSAFVSTALLGSRLGLRLLFGSYSVSMRAISFYCVLFFILIAQFFPVWYAFLYFILFGQRIMLRSAFTDLFSFIFRFSWLFCFAHPFIVLAALCFALYCRFGMYLSIHFQVSRSVATC